MIHRLPWRQLTSEKLRLLAAVAGITFAVLLQLLQFGFRDALYTSSTALHTRFHDDLVMINPQYEFILGSGAFPRSRLYEARGFEGVESVVPVRVGLLPFKNPVSRVDRRGLLVAFNLDDDVFDLASLGVDVDRLRAAETVLLDSQSRSEFRPLIERVRRDGAIRTESNGRWIEIAGLFELGASFTGNAHMLSSDTTFRQLLRSPDGVIELGLIRVKRGSDPEAVRAALASVLPPDVRVVTRDQFAALELKYWNENSPIGFIFALGVFVGLMVGCVIVYQILYTDVTDHLPEYATLKAMGYRDSALALVVLQEAVILSVIGFPAGFVLAQGVYALARQATGLPLFMTGTRIVVVLMLTLTMCTASGLLAMRKLRSADPADAF
jgi:DevC protein